jgi:hypothetical protein
MAQPRFHIPELQRVRRIAGSFAWIDHRLLRNGYRAVMTHQEHSLYLVLAPSLGEGWWGREGVC